MAESTVTRDVGSGTLRRLLKGRGVDVDDEPATTIFKRPQAPPTRAPRALARTSAKASAVASKTPRRRARVSRAAAWLLAATLALGLCTAGAVIGRFALGNPERPADERPAQPSPALERAAIAGAGASASDSVSGRPGDGELSVPPVASDTLPPGEPPVSEPQVPADLSGSQQAVARAAVEALASGDLVQARDLYRQLHQGTGESTYGAFAALLEARVDCELDGGEEAEACLR